MLASATGARRSELVALRWPDIDLGASTVASERSVVSGPVGLVEKGTKTHSARRVSLDVGTVGIVVGHRARVERRGKACGVVIADDAFVLIPSSMGRDGGPRAEIPSSRRKPPLGVVRIRPALANLVVWSRAPCRAPRWRGHP